MPDFLEDALTPLVQSAQSWDELKARVRPSYGEDGVYRARQLAIQLRGSSWLSATRKPQAVQTDESPPWQYRLGRMFGALVQRKLACVTVLAMMVALLFPPFYATLDGVTINLGYGFLLSPPTVGGVFAMVQVPLYATQLAALATMGCLAKWLSR